MKLPALFFAAIYFAVAQQPQAPLPESVTLGCNINLHEQVQVPAQEGGVIKEIFVKEGENVEAGKTLVQIDDSIPQQSVKVAEAELNAAKVQAENPIPEKFALASLAVANAEYKVNEEANRKVKDSVPLVILNRSYLECQQMALSVDKARMDTSIAVKQWEVKKAQLEAAQESLKHRKLVSTLKGQVRELPFHVGEWVQPGDTVVHVVQMNVLRAQGYLKPSEFSPSEIIGRPVAVKVELARGRIETFTGRIAFVDPRIGPNGYEIRALVDNAEENRQWLLSPGMKGQMTIQLK
ncbi:MAG: HlyD family efflux transporter periplasmic adaptor subunit [Pirellulales bacterium]|nr:HlyD family efflux transporter periplasmic adaptor subunit [Pirellulales bacterium]